MIVGNSALQLIIHITSGHTASRYYLTIRETKQQFQLAGLLITDETNLTD